MALKDEGNMIKKTIILDKSDYESIVRSAEINKEKDNKELNSASKIVRKAIKSYIGSTNEDISILMKYTQRELLGYFTYNEAILLINAFNGVLYDINSLLPPKTMLYAEVEDSIQLDNTNYMFNVDAAKILDKIDKLTEFQAYTVIRMCFDFWNLPVDMHQGDKMVNAINKIFMILEQS